MAAVHPGCGYTTGTCAAAACQASVRFLLSGEEAAEARVALPGGAVATVPIRSRRRDNERWFAVKKEPSGDPDITAGLEIWARARFSSRANLPVAFDSESVASQARIMIEGGEGVAVSTLAGLYIPRGYAAINRTPVAMIKRECLALTRGAASVVVTVAVPGGERLARRTFNPRLGLRGGLSILGTTGIVRPMSDQAYLASLLPALDVTHAAGHRRVFLCPGNLGEMAARRLGAPPDAVVQVSNFVGEMVAAAAAKGFSELVYIGHLGKVAKVAAGHLNTHHQAAPLDLEVVASLVPESQPALAAAVAGAVSAEAAIGLLSRAGCLGPLDRTATAAARVLWAHAGRQSRLNVFITDLQGRVVGRAAPAGEDGD